MAALHPKHVVSTTELSKNPGEILDRSHRGPVFIIRNSALESVLVDAETFNRLEQLAEDYLDLLEAQGVFAEPRDEKPVDVRKLFDEMGSPSTGQA